MAELHEVLQELVTQHGVTDGTANLNSASLALFDKFNVANATQAIRTFAARPHQALALPI